MIEERVVNSHCWVLELTKTEIMSDIHFPRIFGKNFDDKLSFFL